MPKRDDSRATGAIGQGKQGAERINPYDDRRPKGRQVEEMFDSIAPAYDFMNAAMTLGLHRHWRSRALRDTCRGLDTAGGKGIEVLDVATGTGDLVTYLKEQLLPEARYTGVDLSQGMLDKALSKTRSQHPDWLESGDVRYEKADALRMPYSDGRFSLVTVAYGVRNFERLAEGLREMHRVLRPGGRICIIELSEPESRLTRGLYRFYSRRMIPFVGRMVSGDDRAYTYLPESIAAAPQRRAMTALMEEAGFSDCRWQSLTFGAVTYYSGFA